MSNSPRTRVTDIIVSDGHMTVRGTAHIPGCFRGIKRVGVAIAKRVGGRRCRFAHRDGAFGPPTKCSHRHFIKADGTSPWSLSLPGELRRGHYVVWARARSALRRGRAARRTFVVR